MQPNHQYNIILADPPWQFRVWKEADKGRSAAHHYPIMTTDDICALPVHKLAAPDCTLFMWACWPNLHDALRVMAGWGFEYKTVGFVWIKQNGSGFGLHMGMGYWTRANTECCLIGVRGKPKRINAAVRQTVLAPLRKHSKKPDEVRHKIVDLMGDLPRVELFARQRAEGWDAIGNEIDGRDIREVLETQPELIGA